jgi:hypothetical protein
MDFTHCATCFDAYNGSCHWVLQALEGLSSASHVTIASVLKGWATRAASSHCMHPARILEQLTSAFEGGKLDVLHDYSQLAIGRIADWWLRQLESRAVPELEDSQRLTELSRELQSVESEWLECSKVLLSLRTEHGLYELLSEFPQVRLVSCHPARGAGRLRVLVRIVPDEPPACRHLSSGCICRPWQLPANGSKARIIAACEKL